jgi:hypothetical protein
MPSSLLGRVGVGAAARDITLGEHPFLACPATERLRRARPGARMLVVAALSGTSGTLAAVTDDGAGRYAAHK